MERIVNTKFYTFSQNNSGGYFVENNENGVAEYVVIEAINAKDAWGKLESIGDKVNDMFNYCPCCGERWYDSNRDEDGTDYTMIYNERIEEVEKSMFR